MRLIEYIPDPFIHALSWSLIHSIWQIAAIALLWRITLVMAHKAPSGVRQNLTLLALLATPAVFLYTFFVQYNRYAAVQKISHLEFDSPVSEILMSRIDNFYLIPVESNALTLFMEAHANYIFWFYWIGMGFCSIYFFLSYARVLQVRTKELTAVPDVWYTIIEQARAKTGLRKSIPVFTSTRVSIPMVTGLFKPIVLFPLAVAASMKMQEVEEILLHEYYHLKCYDHYTNMLQSILEILFFYHPCTWWMSQRLRLEREARVDEWVVSQTSDPLNYAKTLLSLEENRQNRLQPVLAATQSHHSLITRIKNIMQMKTRQFNSGQKIAAMAVMVLAAVSLAWLSPPSFISMNHEDKIMTADDHQPLLTAQNRGDSQTPPSEPRRVVLENGESISWQELSEADKAEIRNAMEEARIAIQEAMREVQMELNSEETRRELQQAREEIKRAMEEVNQELNSEAFRQEMRQARQEIRQALQEANSFLNSEEFRTEMQQAGSEINKAMEELNNIDWSRVASEVNQAMEEAGKTIEMIAPALEELFKNLNLEELFREREKEKPSQH